MKWTRKMGAYEAVYLDGDPACRVHATRLMGAARDRARKKGLPFTLDAWNQLSIQGVLERGRCELTDLPFGKGPFAASLDRIVPAKGYVSGNVRVVCRLINAALGNWGEETLRQVMSAWLPKPPGGAPFDILRLPREAWFDLEEPPAE